MLRMAGDPMIETTIAKSDSFNDLNFIVNPFNGTIGIRSGQCVFNIRLVRFKRLKSGLEFRRNQRIFSLK